MRYLKTYESLKDDFIKNVQTIKKSYNEQLAKIKKEVKEEVDQFMFEITDEYQTNPLSYIDIYIRGDSEIGFKIEYDDIEFKLSKSDEFLYLLEKVSVRIENELELNLKFTAVGNYKDSEDDFIFCDRDMVNLKNLKMCIDELKNDDELGIEHYRIKLRIFIRTA